MKLRQRLVYTPLIVMLLVSITAVFFLDFMLRKSMVDRLHIELNWLASSALVSLSVTLEQQVVTVDQLADRLGRASGARITFVDEEGVIIGDSEVTEADLAAADNHLNRVELIDAHETGTGSAIRHSNTFNENYIYAAVFNNITTQSDTSGYYARVSMSQRSLARQVNKIRLGLAILISSSITALVLLSWLTSRWISRSVQDDQQQLKHLVDERTRDIAAMQELGSLLGACSHTDEAINVVMKMMPQLFQHSTGAVSVFKASRNRLDVLVEWGDSWPGSQYFVPEECWALRKGHNHRSDNHGAQIFCPHMLEFDQSSTLCIPLLAHGDTIGVFHLIDDNQDADTEALANSAARHIALALANIELRYHLRQQAIRDALTGLYNRRYLNESLEQLVSRADRSETNIGVIMIDIDHFKRFNDQFGHDAGDLILKTISKEFQNQTRGEDLVCRYGGEEFCIICPDSSPQQTELIAKKLCDNIRSLSLHFEDHDLGQITLSAGVALYPHIAPVIEDVISQADKALYNAKHKGRNRVEMATIE